MIRSQAAVLACLLVAYAAFYLCRANVDAALPFLVRAGYGDKTAFGALASVATVAYALGKIALGAAGDVLGGRRLMLVAVLGSVACSFAFGVSSAFVAFVLLAALNRFFQAGGWPGVVQVVALRFEPARHGLIMGILSTSYELGNVVALALSGVVARHGWRSLFVVNPVLLACLGGAAVLSLPRAAPGSTPAEPSPPGAKGATAKRRFRVAPLLAHPSLWAALVLSALLTFIRIGLLTWTPTYLAEVSRARGDLEISASIVKSAVFPAAGVVAALFAGPVSDRLGPGRRAPVIASCLAVVVLLVFALGHGGASASVPLIGAVGLFLLGPYSLLAGAIALDLGGRDGSATASGLIDGAGYLGAAAAPALLGRLADRSGWTAAFDVVAVAALIATAAAAAWSALDRKARQAKGAAA